MFLGTSFKHASAMRDSSRTIFLLSSLACRHILKTSLSPKMLESQGDGILECALRKTEHNLTLEFVNRWVILERLDEVLSGMAVLLDSDAVLSFPYESRTD